MDKKKAEEDAMKKAKDTQAAAGKSSGMSGRDLVRIYFLFLRLLLSIFLRVSAVN